MLKILNSHIKDEKTKKNMLMLCHSALQSSNKEYYKHPGMINLAGLLSLKNVLFELKPKYKLGTEGKILSSINLIVQKILIFSCKLFCSFVTKRFEKINILNSINITTEINQQNAKCN